MELKKLLTHRSSENVEIFGVLQDLLDVVEGALAVLDVRAEQVQGGQVVRQQVRHRMVRQRMMIRRKVCQRLKRKGNAGARNGERSLWQNGKTW